MWVEIELTDYLLRIVESFTILSSSLNVCAYSLFHNLTAWDHQLLLCRKVYKEYQ